MNYLLGLDIGTSGTKTALFSEDGSLAASATYDYPLYQPKNGYAEQNPADWWDASVKGIRAVLLKSGVFGADIKGVGLSGQMHGLVMLGEQNEVLRPSIIWCDQRTAAECRQITELVGLDKLMEITASPALTGFTASKILWVRNNEPELYEKCRHILLPKDYIRFRLTGAYATDVSDGSGMQLMDIRRRCWSDYVLEKLSIDKSLLPKLYESPEITGFVTDEIAALTGLSAGTPVVAGAGDNAAAAVGTGVVRDKTAFTTIGTSGVVFAHTSEMSVDKKGRIHTFCAAVPGQWHVMGVTQGAGLSLKWFRDNFCAAEKETAAGMGVDPYYLMDSEAKTVPIGSNGLLYLPYLMGERTPHLDPDARGVFFGLSAMHQKKDLLRAVMEGVTFSLKDCLSLFAELDIKVDDMMACGGGGSSPLWRQMLADVFGCKVKTVLSSEGGALGAAILAGVGAGLYPSVQSACDYIIKIKGEQQPDEQNSKNYEPFYDFYRQLYPALKDSFSALGKMQ